MSEELIEIIAEFNHVMTRYNEWHNDLVEAVRAIKKNTVVIRKEENRKRIGNIGYSSVKIIGGFLVIGGTLAAPVSLGMSLNITIAGIGVAGSGTTASFLHDWGETYKISKVECNERITNIYTKTNTFEKKLYFCEVRAAEYYDYVKKSKFEILEEKPENESHPVVKQISKVFNAVANQTQMAVNVVESKIQHVHAITHVVRYTSSSVSDIYKCVKKAKAFKTIKAAKLATTKALPSTLSKKTLTASTVSKNALCPFLAVLYIAMEGHTIFLNVKKMYEKEKNEKITSLEDIVIKLHECSMNYLNALRQLCITLKKVKEDLKNIPLTERRPNFNEHIKEFEQWEIELESDTCIFQEGISFQENELIEMTDYSENAIDVDKKQYKIPILSALDKQF